MRRPVMREMSNWSAMVSSTTESSASFLVTSIASNFSACGTVRGNPSSTNLHKGTQHVNAIDARCFSADYAPVLAQLVVLQLVPNHAHHDVVRDEPTSIHDFLGLDAQCRLLHHL